MTEEPVGVSLSSNAASQPWRGGGGRRGLSFVQCTVLASLAAHSGLQSRRGEARHAGARGLQCLSYRTSEPSIADNAARDCAQLA